ADALIAITDAIRLKLNEKHFVMLTSIDIENAFPSVHREQLLHKLYEKYNISDHWIRNYFLDRQHYVTTNGLKSNLINSFIGVIQGSSLGSLLFTLFINDLTEDIHHGISTLFVDDTHMVTWDKNLQELKTKTIQNLQNVNEYT